MKILNLYAGVGDNCKLWEEVDAYVATKCDEMLDRLESWVKYNKHDMGELGEFIRTQYFYNKIEAERKK